MLKSLYVKNFKNLNDFCIPVLGRVNLITGKNNTGKSSLLEALALYASKGDLGVIAQILKLRGEIIISHRASGRLLTRLDIFSYNFRSLCSLFSNREMNVGSEIEIAETERITDNQKDKNSLRIKYVVMENNQQVDSIETDQIENNPLLYHTLKNAIQISLGDNWFYHRLDYEFENYFLSNPWSMNSISNVQFLSARNIDIEFNSFYWDKITLTPKEKHVIDAIRIIEPYCERINFVKYFDNDIATTRYPVIKRSTSDDVVPLLSMGDGINRILNIALAMVNAENGFLLIDEFENGLHHTTQSKLWELIFKLSEKLNVQVFATTHSEDCVRAFSQVLNEQKDKTVGRQIRLEKFEDNIRCVEYDANELRVAAEQGIETR